ncbi:MAG: ATP-binding protein [Pseudomonadota bacterium]|nr:ATP-binding protein [Pseudomonadota bacterium]
MIENRKIMIVDDDPGVRSSLQSILNSAHPGQILDQGEALFPATGEDPHSTSSAGPDYDLVVVDCGEKAVAAAIEAFQAGEPISVAFIDMMMPGLSGAETAREIWRIDPDMKAVFVTAYSEATPDEIIRITGRSDHFYLRKPFNSEVIKQFAASLTRQWNLERERSLLSGRLEKANLQLKDLNENLESKVKAQAAMLFQSEKMASIGILAAGVAHEINNPVAFVISNLESLVYYSATLKELVTAYRKMGDLFVDGRYDDAAAAFEAIRQQEVDGQIEFILDDLVEMVAESQEGAVRIRDIVKDLRAVSRDDQDNLGYVDINQMIDSILNIIRNEVKHKADVVKEYGKLPQVKCFPQKIGQVFMNILINAVQAIIKWGSITITTKPLVVGRRRVDNLVEIKITDTGCGIDKDAIKKIFDPFFTTKKVGCGTGLGMSISHDIIKVHGGTIKVESEVGVGTTFTVQLPVEMVLSPP